MKAQDLIRELKRYNIGPYIEVPCSILAPVISQLLKDKDCELMNPASEAAAMGLAAGSYLATQRVPVVLMQNSGLCNALNAITSLNYLYRIPVLFIISWRGEPETKDAPEHYVMGMKLRRLLNLLNIPHAVLSDRDFKKEICDTVRIIERTKRPAALILRRNLLQEDEHNPVRLRPISSMMKSKAVDIILNISYDKACFVTTNGFISREVFYNLKSRGIEEANPAFYMLGSMGHALSIALGLERHLNANRKKIVVLDGDGGCLMHLGSLTYVGQENPRRLIHVVLDDGAYTSTGGQPTASRHIDLCKIARGCGYRKIYKFAEQSRLKSIFPVLLKKSGPTFVHILVSNKKDMHKPRISESYTCEEIKECFLRITS